MEFIVLFFFFFNPPHLQVSGRRKHRRSRNPKAEDRTATERKAAGLGGKLRGAPASVFQVRAPRQARATPGVSGFSSEDEREQVCPLRRSERSGYFSSLECPDCLWTPGSRLSLGLCPAAVGSSFVWRPSCFPSCLSGPRPRSVRRNCSVSACLRQKQRDHPNLTPSARPACKNRV